MRAPFADRRAAGRVLAERLHGYAGRDGLIVLGLPRGGVPVAFEVASSLHAPLDLMLVRKLGLPGHEELAWGAIATGGIVVLNDDVLSEARLDAVQIERITVDERRELDRRERLYRGERMPPQLMGRTVLVVDDGLATGATMRAAVQAVRARGAAAIVAAVPVAARQTRDEIGRIADAITCVWTPEPFIAVGRWYQDFKPSTDAEVRELMAAAQTVERQP